jgi:uncharacterized membrane protein (UPF0127 family)
VSARRIGILLDSLLLLTLVVLIGGGVLLVSQTTNKELTLDGVRYNLETVRKPADLAKGLGGRNSLPERNGMLFIFDKADKHCFWMKDMRFSLDIIWLDVQKRVVHVAPAVSANSYPQQFCPDKPAKYVIELNPGLVGSQHEGQKLSF